MPRSSKRLGLTGVLATVLVAEGLAADPAARARERRRRAQGRTEEAHHH
ncbi:hypothetical protein [Streptomyces sp. NPDC058964]